MSANVDPYGDKGGSGQGGMGRKSGVPEGDAFLPGTTAAELKRLARRETDAKSSQKYLAAMHRKMGKSNQDIAEHIGENYEVVRVWLADIHEGGISAIPRRKSPGPPRKMPLRTRQEIMVAVHKGPQAVGYNADCWTFKSLYRYAKEKLGADITYAGAVKAFREMGLRSKIPRPEHPPAAGTEERIAYQRKAKKGLEASGKAAEGGGVGLPTCADLEKQEKMLPPERREKIPAILANSGIPDKVLANLPDVLLYESPNKVRLARQFGCAGRDTAKRNRTG